MRIRVRGRWWRITRPGTSALFYSVDAFDARWQTGAVVRGLYLADCEDTAWAEWLRATAEQGVPPASRLPRAMCPLAVNLDGIADLTGPRLLTGLGLGPMRPTQAQWPETQPVGERLWRAGAAGILSPSAAHQGLHGVDRVPHRPRRAGRRRGQSSHRPRRHPEDPHRPAHVGPHPHLPCPLTRRRRTWARPC